MAQWTLPFFYTLFALSSTARAQTSSAVCLPYYSWISNSQGKTPCEVASSLLATCSDDKTFDVVSLPLGQHYQGPPRVSSATPCQCNTVVFSLMSACGICQGRTALRWSQWSSNCPRVSLGEFPNPLPEGIKVPAWAYLDVKGSDVFDQFIAQDLANSTESTAGPTPSSTDIETHEGTTPLAASTEAPSSSETPAPEQTPLTPEEEEAKKAAAQAYANTVAGSVVGAFLGIIPIAVVAFVLARRRRRNLTTELGMQEESMAEQAPTNASVPSIRVSVSASSRQEHR